MADTIYAFSRTRAALLVCEERRTVSDGDRSRFETVTNSKRCNDWTPHSFDGSSSNGFLNYRCDNCGARRVWGYEIGA